MSAALAVGGAERAIASGIARRISTLSWEWERRAATAASPEDHAQCALLVRTIRALRGEQARGER